MWTITFVCAAILATSHAQNEYQLKCADQLMRLMAPHPFGNRNEPPTCLIEAGGGEKLTGLMSKGEHILQSNDVVVPRNVTAMVSTIIDFAGRNADFKEVLTDGCKMTNTVLMCVEKKRNELKCNITLIELLGGSPFSDGSMSEYNLIEAGGLQPCTDLAKLLMVNKLF